MITVEGRTSPCPRPLPAAAVAVGECHAAAEAVLSLPGGGAAILTLGAPPDAFGAPAPNSSASWRPSLPPPELCAYGVVTAAGATAGPSVLRDGHRARA
jgi:hypothetical protein